MFNTMPKPIGGSSGGGGNLKVDFYSSFTDSNNPISLDFVPQKIEIYCTYNGSRFF